jgi:hypothetical protein
VTRLRTSFILTLTVVLIVLVSLTGAGCPLIDDGTDAIVLGSSSLLTEGAHSFFWLDVTTTRAGGHVVWGDDRRPDLSFDVYEFDLSGGRERRLAKGSAALSGVSAEDGVVVWTDARPSDFGDPAPDTDVFGFELDENAVLVVSQAQRQQTEASVAGRTVAWADARGGLRSQDLEGGEEAVIAKGDGGRPVVFDDGHAVAWVDQRGEGRARIRARLLPDGKVVTVAAARNIHDLVQVGDAIVYSTGFPNEPVTTVFVWRPGDAEPLPVSVIDGGTIGYLSGSDGRLAFVQSTDDGRVRACGYDLARDELFVIRDWLDEGTITGVAIDGLTVAWVETSMKPNGSSDRLYAGELVVPD